MKRIALILVILLIAVLIGLPKAQTKATYALVNSYPASISFVYNPSTTSVNIKLSNLENVSLISYALSYKYKGVKQGVEGSFSPNSKTNIEKNVFLGTCSGKDCILHGYITNVFLQVTFTYNDGYKVTKTITK